MHEFEFQQEGTGCIGVLPCGESYYFDSIDEYKHAYEDEENDIIEGLDWLDEVLDYPEDWTL